MPIQHIRLSQKTHKELRKKSRLPYSVQGLILGTSTTLLVETALTDRAAGQTVRFRSKPIVNQMMANAKKILITTESHEIFILRMDGQKQAFGHCETCGREVEMLTIDQAVLLSSLRTGELVRMAESERIHAIETDSGHLLLCRNSLKDFCS